MGCEGCLRLKGEAKSFDIHCLIYNNERAYYKLKQVLEHLETNVHQLEEEVHHEIEEIEKAMIRRDGSLELQDHTAKRRPIDPGEQPVAQIIEPPPIPAEEPDTGDNSMVGMSYSF